MLGVVEGQLAGGVVVHHLGDAGEYAAALVQGEAALLGLRYDDVNAPLAGPATHTHKNPQASFSFYHQRVYTEVFNLHGRLISVKKLICSCCKWLQLYYFHAD